MREDIIEKPTVSLGVLMQIGGRFMTLKLEDAARGSNLAPAQLSVLGMVCRYPGLTQSDYGDMLYIGNATLGRHAIRLENEGYIERTRGTEDSREVRLNPTSSGSVLFDQVGSELALVGKALAQNMPDGAYEQLTNDVAAFLKSQGWSLPDR